MAPWPENGNEPKAPDKEEKGDTVEVASKIEAEDSGESAACARSEQKQPDEKEVLTLDEGQLKALLDEAITYKNPKDREGKSELFKELLQEAEADESDSKGLGGSLGGKLPRGYYNLPARRRQSRHSGQGRECGVGVSSTRGGSLQNLNALGMEGGRRSRRRDNLVSARQREGGSLPTNVNVDNDPDLDMLCPNYTSRATLEVAGAAKEETAGTEESTTIPIQKIQGPNVPNGTEVQNAKEDDTVSASYASSLCVGPVESGAMLYPSNPVQHVSVLSIPPSQIHIGSGDPRISDSLEPKKLNTSQSRHKKAMMPSETSEEADSASEGLLGLPLTAYWNRYSSFTFLDFQDSQTRMAFGNSSDVKVKPVDENGNALGCVRVDSNCIDRKKRRIKAKNDRNTILSDEIEGFRGGADIDTLMEYIESPSNVLDPSKSSKSRSNQSNGTRTHVKVRAKEEDSRPIRRRKDKFQRCNSLEEISKTKLEDLTEESSNERLNGSSVMLTKKPVTFDDAELGKMSWADEVEASLNAETNKDLKEDIMTPEPVQDSEFHVVTKKQRRKKRRTGCSSRGVTKPDYYSTREGGPGRLLYQCRGEQGTTQPRRKSASSVPPSDKSDSSDLDSVHSLPVSSTSTRTQIGKNSVSGGSTPQAVSYADIARTAASPPDGSQVNIYRQEKFSPNSCTYPHIERPSVLTSELLPLPFASFKKDAMTDTNCDKSPGLTTEDYPPLEVKFPDFVDTFKRAGSIARDSEIPTEKLNFKTASASAISTSRSGDGPHSLPIDFQCVKSSQSIILKRPPVILMDEPSINSQVTTEITFGFEVNQQLLQCEEDTQCNPNTNVPTSVASTPAPEIQDQVQPLSASQIAMIEHLTAAWEEAMEKLRAGKIKYYDGQ